MIDFNYFHIWHWFWSSFYFVPCLLHSPPYPFLFFIPFFTIGLFRSVSVVCRLFLVSVGLVFSPFSCSPPSAAVAPQAVEAGRAGRDFLFIHASAYHPHRPVSFLQWDRLGVECTVWRGFTDHLGKKTDAQGDVIPQICPNVVWWVLYFHSLYAISDCFAIWRHLRFTSLSTFGDLFSDLFTY